MKKFESPAKNIGYLIYRWTSPLIDFRRLGNSLLNFPLYFKDVATYSIKSGHEKIRVIDTYPILGDRSPGTPFDAHYFYQDIWAAKKIYDSKVKIHIDVGSNVEFAGFLSAFTKVKFIDIRPLKVKLRNFIPLKGSVLNLPFRSNSVKSVSCLHVAEHIGLGRYGDSLDPYGTKKACLELSRVLAKGGNFYFALPVGKPRLCFNAHRIHSPQQILEYFKDLKLIELSGITDSGKFVENINVRTLQKSDYACGLFRFTKI